MAADWSKNHVRIYRLVFIYHVFDDNDTYCQESEHIHVTCRFGMRYVHQSTIFEHFLSQSF
jgi:hypothetical protein